jgi:predicted transcriptional regulator
MQTKNEKFTTEHDSFLRILVDKYSHVKNELQKWKIIQKEFHEKYSESTKSSKQLKDHYHNSVNPNISKIILDEQKEQEIINLLWLKGTKYQEIANELKLSPNCVKNYFNQRFKNEHEDDYKKILKIGKKNAPDYDPYDQNQFEYEFEFPFFDELF